MAEIEYTKPDRAPFANVWTWADVTESDTFEPVMIERQLFAYSMQVSGTFGGASVALHGSIDGTNYVALTDSSGTAFAVTADGIVSGGDLVKYLKPVATGGTSQSLTISIIAGYSS